MAVEPRPRNDAVDPAVLAENDASLRNVEVERAARHSRPEERIECTVARHQDRLQQRSCRLVGSTVARVLHLIVGPPRGGTHQDRKSVVSGTRVSVRVDLGGARTIKKKNINTTI